MKSHQNLQIREVAALLDSNVFGYLKKMGREGNFISRVVVPKKNLANLNTTEHI